MIEPPDLEALAAALEVLRDYAFDKAFEIPVDAARLAAVDQALMVIKEQTGRVEEANRRAR